ncbi:MAG TPA: DinB family protein [Longimicrobium sp.]|jgi:uncharacterized damage-inducible protein DinB|uniref:DinB family protein n=1 Tax=Longimicrobium sp. TaxID=2029185 RepID=UPI002ED9AC5F
MTETATTTEHSIARTALADLEPELAATRRVLERVPTDQLGWKPHPKSFSIGDLASHVANLTGWTSVILTSDELDLATQGKQSSPESSAAILAMFDENAAAVRGAITGAADATMQGQWTLRVGDHVILQMPRVAVIRSMVLNHIIHHRAQIGVYLRMLDIPVPATYGPTADEQWSG